MNSELKLWHLNLYFTIENKSNLYFKLEIINVLFSSSFVSHKGAYELNKWLQLNDDVDIYFHHKNLYSHLKVCIEIKGILDKYLKVDNKMNFVKEFLHMLFDDNMWKIDQTNLNSLKADLHHQALIFEQDPSKASLDEHFRLYFDNDTYFKFTPFNKYEIDTLTSDELEKIFNEVLNNLIDVTFIGFDEKEKEEILSILPPFKEVPHFEFYKHHKNINENVIVKNGYEDCLTMGFYLPPTNRVFDEFLMNLLCHEQMYFFKNLREEKGLLYYFEPVRLFDYSYIMFILPIGKEHLIDAISYVREFFNNPSLYCDISLFKRILHEFILDVKAVSGSYEERIEFESKEKMERNPLTYEEYLDILEKIKYNDFIKAMNKITYTGSVFASCNGDEDEEEAF